MFDKRSLQSDDADPGMTSMVDVTFLLLIFFVVTASFQLQRAIAVPSQQSNDPSRTVIDRVDKPEVVELRIDEFGSFVVVAGHWEAETIGKQALIAKLKEALASTSGETALTVRVHQESQLQSLVDGMDAGTIAGFRQLRIVQVDELI